MVRLFLIRKILWLQVSLSRHTNTGFGYREWNKCSICIDTRLADNCRYVTLTSLAHLYTHVDSLCMRGLFYMIHVFSTAAIIKQKRLFLPTMINVASAAINAFNTVDL